MADRDVFSRSYLFVDVPERPTTEAVAALLDAAADMLRTHGEVTVHHVAFESTEGAGGPLTTVTLYYDRVERRRRERPGLPASAFGS